MPELGAKGLCVAELKASLDQKKFMVNKFVK